MRIKALACLALTVSFFGNFGVAETTVATEVSTLSSSTITLYLQGFLHDDELAMLRLIATNEEALALFVPDTNGFAAIAVAPREGFLRDGAPVLSAIAIAGLPDAETARTEALAGCDAARDGGKPCVIVLEVAPTE